MRPTSVVPALTRHCRSGYASEPSPHLCRTRRSHRRHRGCPLQLSPRPADRDLLLRSRLHRTARRLRHRPCSPPYNRFLATTTRTPRSLQRRGPRSVGRNLIARRLRAEAGSDGRPAPTLDDRDYLLGVSDETRQGALRFKTDVDDVFQHPAPDVPKLIALPALLHAANAVSRDEPDNLEAIKTLLDAGTGSLGGARPKASVRDDETLMIAMATYRVLHSHPQHRRPPSQPRISGRSTPRPVHRRPLQRHHGPTTR